MSLTLSITEDEVMTAIRSFLLTVFPGTEIVQGQDNRVTMPDEAGWILLTPILSARLATNIDTWSNAGAPTTQADQTFWRHDVQVDCFGASAHDNATIIGQLWRDDYAYSNLVATGYDIAPLYASDLRNLEFVNDSAQYEKRWSIDLSLQASPVVNVPQQFAGVAQVTPISVDATYPPH